jgi:hypothetical protein
MGYDQRPTNSSSSGVILAVFALGGVVLVGVFLLGGLLLYSRQSHSQVQRAVMQREVSIANLRAVEQHARAQASVQLLPAPPVPVPFGATTPVRQHAVHVQADGQIMLGEEPIEIAEMIQRVSATGESKNAVVHLTADSDCPFSKISGILSKFRDVGITSIDVQPISAK